MNYFEIKISCPMGQTEDAENTLIINGITDYFVSDPMIEQEILAEMPWLIKDELMTGDAVITVCTQTKEQAEEIKKLFSDSYSVTVRNASDTEWKDNWKQFAHEVHIDDNLVICPAWVDYQKKENEKIIVLDSGAAFGTGTHETTKQCAKMLKKHFKSGETLLDIGTGSGILAIVGGVCGALKITATDIDPVACDTAKININRNGFESICEVKCGDLLECVGDKKYDVITANIIVDVLLHLFCDVKKVLKPDGTLIMSGILNERLSEIKTAAEKNGFTVIDETQENDWVCIAFKGKKL